jgi:UDP-glucose 4-epimerase
MVNATFTLFEQCVRSNVRKIVMASAASIYGTPDAFPTTERQSPYANRTILGAAKCFGEQVLRAFNEMYGVRYVALRYFDVYGPRMDAHGGAQGVLIRWIERLAAGLRPIVVGDGLQTMDLLHVGDVARANLLAAVSPASDVALNVGSGEDTSLLALVHVLARIMGRPDIEPIFWEERNLNAVPRRLADTKAARRAIGFEAAIPLNIGLADLAEWWRTQSTAPQNVA